MIHVNEILARGYKRRPRTRCLSVLAGTNTFFLRWGLEIVICDDLCSLTIWARLGADTVLMFPARCHGPVSAGDASHPSSRSFADWRCSKQSEVNLESSTTGRPRRVLGDAPPILQGERQYPATFDNEECRSMDSTCYQST
jgi:hypothetical protein